MGTLAAPPVPDHAAPSPAAKPHRVDSVDFLRGIAMMGLVLVHSVLYFTPLNVDVDLVYAVFGYALGDVGAALFTTLVCVSFALSMAWHPPESSCTRLSTTFQGCHPARP